MSTITTIQASDIVKDSRAVINTNFSNLNSDKIETSVLDTDNTLAANSDTKIPSQKAVKTYVDTGGNVNASETTKGIVEEATDAEVTAGTATGGTGAKLFVTPAKLITQIGVITVNAGETINGGTLPVPVYQNPTDNEVYACDANVNTKYKFIGFAISNSTDGNSILVKTSGIVSGFTGLDEGTSYYVSDSVGTISTTPGTQEIMVGVAISTTQLFIQKGVFRASGTLTVTTASSTQTITTGFRISAVRFWVFGSEAGATIEYEKSFGVWTKAGGNSCISIEDAGPVIDTTYCFRINDNGTETIFGQVANITATTFDIELTNDPTKTAYILWDAEGDF